MKNLRSLSVMFLVGTMLLSACAGNARGVEGEPQVLEADRTSELFGLVLAACFAEPETLDGDCTEEEEDALDFFRLPDRVKMVVKTITDDGVEHEYELQPTHEGKYLYFLLPGEKILRASYMGPNPELLLSVHQDNQSGGKLTIKCVNPTWAQFERLDGDDPRNLTSAPVEIMELEFAEDYCPTPRPSAGGSDNLN